MDVNQRSGFSFFDARLVGNFTHKPQRFRRIEKMFDVGWGRELNDGGAISGGGKKQEERK